MVWFFRLSAIFYYLLFLRDGGNTHLYFTVDLLDYTRLQ